MQSHCRHVAQKLFCNAKESSVLIRGYIPTVYGSAFPTSSASIQSDAGSQGAAQFPWSTFVPSLRGEQSKHAFEETASLSWPSYGPFPMRSPSACMLPRRPDQVSLGVEAAWTQLCAGTMLRQADKVDSFPFSVDMNVLDQRYTTGDGCRQSVLPIDMPHQSGDAAPLECIKRTYQPGVLIRKRRHGFLSRLRTANGRRVLARRKAKGRRKISA